MLKTKLLHPEILQTLASNGHGSRVLIADGNYPFATGSPAAARKVYLNLAADLLPVIDVLKVLVDSIPIERALVMQPADGSIPEIYAEFADVLGVLTPLEKLERFAFYDEAKSPDTCLVIATGESRRFSNILLTIGVVK
jgi:L-fucose mutarotase